MKFPLRVHLFFFILSFPGLVLSAPLPDYTTEKHIDGELYMVDKIWKGKGQVIVGKIDPKPQGAISCRTPVYKDGNFTASIAEGRELTFYAHGYDRLVVNDTKRIRRKVEDAGIVSFVRTAPTELRQWTATIDAPDHKGEITAALHIPNQDYLFEDHGYSGGARPLALVETRKIQPGDTLRFEGLSRIPYKVVLSGEGLIEETIEIDPAESGWIDAGKVQMKPASILEFTFRTRTRATGAKWSEDAKTTRTEIACDGKAELPLTTVRDGLGNSIKLRLDPEVNGISASFFFYGKNSFVDLGKGKPGDNFGWDEGSRRTGQPRIILKDGHRYLFWKEDVNGIDIETLFSVRRVR